MTVANLRTADRVESFIAAVDSYEPHKIEEHEDAFRVFARFMSRSLDGRYLERHPPAELLPDIEQLMHATLKRDADEIKVRLTVTDDVAGRRGVLVTCMPDQPFIYSTVRLALDYLNVRIFRTLNSVIPIRRSATGEMSAVGTADAPRESFVWIELEADNLAARKAEIESYIKGRLEGCRDTVADFVPIRQRVADFAARFEALAKDRPDHRRIYEDNARLLRWLLQDRFVFMGTHYMPGNTKNPLQLPDLGIGKHKDSRGIRIEDAERAVLDADGLPPFLWVRKSHTESWLYRPGKTDHVLVQCYDDKGTPAGILVIEGLWNFQALVEPRTEIPLLDRVIEQIYAQLQATKGSHRYRTIRNAFNSLPLEYLFSLSVDDIRQLVQEVLEVDVEHRLQVHITADELQNTAFVFVALPRSHYSDDLRSDLKKQLKEAFRASSVDDGVYAGDVDSVTVHYFLTGAKSLDARAEAVLRGDIETLASPWSDRLNDELTKRHGVKKARQLHGLYSEAFGARYQEETSINRAVTDIEFLEELSQEKTFDCDLYREKGDAEIEVTRLRMFEHQSIILSKIMPVLDNLGLNVIDQFPTTAQVPGRQAQEIATFRLAGVRDFNVDLLTRKNRLAAAIRAVVAGCMDNDSLNRLLLRADIAWNYVALIRAYQHYSRQMQFPHSFATIEDALLRHADIVRGITELFRAKFDPDLEGLASDTVDDKRLEVVERSRRALLTQLEGVDDLVSDQVLRQFYELVEATIRTNFYSRDPDKDHKIVLKLDPSKLARLPEPKPFREIYVHHPLVAGVHLRGGPVARGGLRWSDRPFDFRTEVLGLMATQNLKNVLIVPRGAKGGFVLRQPPADALERRAMADEVYKIFVGGLLDVTDNLVNNQPVTPPGVLRYDAHDHYLVVAADKGTAHLSDTANAIAQARGFWLGDAFASGGSKGYDHKKEAITAKGAWECTKRHFHEMGQNPEVDRLRVVGIGDMSGDVFGNGLLRSKSLELVAAFDHRNIFIDPSPDPLTSFKARDQLFKMPRSSWEDYPRAALSKGAGIYPRSAKAIKLSVEARDLLGITQETISGPELVRLLLCLPVDLLWNGGIGTYIKSPRETNLEVGDPANDTVRVDATDIRAKVIGEGGNLGITQQGRIDLAQKGVRLNTDALDNSAGVDLSDHEVNLKILFQMPLVRGQLTLDERDKLMEEAKPEINRLVLLNNWLQSRMVSLDLLRAKREPSRFNRALMFLSERVPFNRRDMHLPGERVIKERAQRGESLTRPELAVLAANAKLDLRQELVKAVRIDVQKLNTELHAYFPELITKRWKSDVDHHPLAINMARTILSNNIIGDAGATWLAETTMRTGKSTEEILDSYLLASQLLDAPRIKRELDRLELTTEAAKDYRMRLIIEDAIEEVSSWLLRRDAPLPVGFDEALKTAQKLLPSCVEPQDATAITALSNELAASGIARDVADALAVLVERTSEVIDIALLTCLAKTAGITLDVQAAGTAYFKLGEATGLLNMVRGALDSTSTESFDRPARFAMRGQLRMQLLHLVLALLKRESDLSKPSTETATFIDHVKHDLAPLLTSRELCNLVMATDRVERRVHGIRAVV